MRRLSPLALVWLLAACSATVSAPTAPIPPAPPPAAEPVAEMAGSLHWVRNSAEYRALLYQTYRLAADELERIAERQEPGTWAVALDADETVISNSQYEKERSALGEGFSPESWDAWVRREEATPLPGAKAFLDRVHELGGRIAIVTNRNQEHCPATEENFRRRDLPFDVILCKPPGGSDKEPRWERVEQGTAAPDLPPLTIVLWLGDNIRDFPGLDQPIRSEGPSAFELFGSRYFIVPNPLYGSWEDNPQQ